MTPHTTVGYHRMCSFAASWSGWWWALSPVLCISSMLTVSVHAIRGKAVANYHQAILSSRHSHACWSSKTSSALCWPSIPMTGLCKRTSESRLWQFQVFRWPFALWAFPCVCFWNRWNEKIRYANLILNRYFRKMEQALFLATRHSEAVRVMVVSSMAREAI